MLIQNVVFLRNASSKYVLGLFPSFCIGVDNNFYFYDTCRLEDILIVFQNNICRKQGDADSGVTGSHVGEQ